MPALLAAASLALTSPIPAQAEATPDFKLARSSVTPEEAFFAAAPVRIEFRFIASAPSDVTVAIAGAGGEIRRLELKALAPGVTHTTEWDGLTGAGVAAPDDRYRVLIEAAGGAGAQAGGVTLRGHARAPDRSRARAAPLGSLQLSAWIPHIEKIAR